MSWRIAFISLGLAGVLHWQGHGQQKTVYIVPNTHGTIGGWLVDFDTERNYVLNNYLEHLALAAQSPSYRFVWSEGPNLISLFELEPLREAQLRCAIKEGKVELVNGFFLESDVTLTGGETLAQLGVRGIRWHEGVFGVRPRFGWAIDITGAHRQLPQIVGKLGLEAVVFTRNNPAGRTAFWWKAPDGTRALAVTAQAYMEMRELFRTADPGDEAAHAAVKQAIEARLLYSPSPRLALFPAGAGDYSLPPALGVRVDQFLQQWRGREPDVELRFGTMSDYLAALREELKRGAALPEYEGDTAYCFNGFWSAMPEVKHAFRRTEGLLHAAELAAASASLHHGIPYPARALDEAWILLLLNADRNTIWGAAAGEVFRSQKHWDAWDRFRGAEQRLRDVLRTSIGRRGSGLAVFSSLNWRREDPVEVRLPGARTPAGALCMEDPAGGGVARCRMTLPAGQAVRLPWEAQAAEKPVPVDPPAEIRTRRYTARIDRSTGEIETLLSAGGKAILTAGSGRIHLEEPPEKIAKTAADFMAPKRQRRAVSRCAVRPAVQAWRGRLALVIKTTMSCPGFHVERRTWFYDNFPRIDFEISLDLKRSDVLVVTDFPFAGRVDRRTRGIPYGFSEGSPSEDWLRPQPYFLARASEHNHLGYSAAVLPALGWSDYRLAGGGGLTLVEAGLPMHEFSPDRLTLGLVNAVSTYRGLPNEDLRGLGRHEFRFGILPHEGDWREVEAPRRAREFAMPPVVIEEGGPLPPLVRTSENLIVEAVRREGSDLEVRLAEWRGQASMGWVECLTPHREARRTNLLGEDARPLGRAARYRFPVMPQEVMTVRFRLESTVEATEPLRTWAPLVPEEKKEALRMRIREKGHPPRPF
ncbi:MAG: hypothetical protein ACUVS7_02690 [Bryobacteraceae bacterium]